MKKLLATGLVLLALSGQSVSAKVTDGERFATTIVAGSVCAVYCVSLAYPGTLLGTSIMISALDQIAKQRKEVAAIVLNDTQEYYSNGNISASLSTVISNLEASYPEHSESEIIDAIAELAINI